MDSDILEEFSDVTESLNIVSEEITDYCINNTMIIKWNKLQ